MTKEYVEFLRPYPTENPIWFKGCKYMIKYETLTDYFITYTDIDNNIIGNKPINKSFEDIVFIKKRTENPNYENERKNT